MPARIWLNIVAVQLLWFSPGSLLAQDAYLPPGSFAPAPTPPAVYRLSLEDAKQRAVTANQGLGLARLNLLEKGIVTAAAKTDYLPKILANVAYFHFNSNLGSVETIRTGQRGILPPGSKTISVNALNQDSSFGAITLAQPITKLIAVNAAVRISKADAEIARAQLDKGTRDLLSGVAQAFYGLHGARRIESALGLQVNYAKQLAMASPQPDVRIALIEAQQALLQVRSQSQDISEQLNSLLCFPAGTFLDLVEPMPPAPPVASVEEAIQLALAANPQVREAMAGIEKAQAAYKIAKSEFLPDINVFGSYFNQTAAPVIQSNFGAIGVSATYTFVDWGKRRRVRDQRQTQISEAHLNVRVTMDKVVLEARQSYQAYEKAHEALRLAEEMARARKDAESGIKAPLPLATAKAATAKAELEAMQAEVAYRVAHAQLLGVIGGE